MKQLAVGCALALFIVLGHPVSGDVVFVDLGHGPPPVMVGPYPMTAADLGPQESIQDLDPVSSLGQLFGEGTVVSIFPTTTKFTVPDSWPAWGHGYRGPVFLLSDRRQNSVNFNNGGAVYFYLRPRTGSLTVDVSAEGTSSGPVTLSAADGARGFAFYGTEASGITNIQILLLGEPRNVGIAEFGWSSHSSVCSTMPIGLGQEVSGLWVDDCQSTDFSGARNAQFFSLELQQPTVVEIELNSPAVPTDLYVREGSAREGQFLARDTSFLEDPSRLALDLPAGIFTIEATQVFYQPDVPFTLRVREIDGLCMEGQFHRCIDGRPDDRRYRVQVSFDTVLGGGASGEARWVLSDFDRGGVFWFFDANNPEVMVKVLNGCPVNGHFWVFVASVTNVGHVVTVTDTLTGEVWTYENPDQNVAIPVQDTRAFSCD